MPIFDNDDKAWSMWTKNIELLVGNLAAGNIVQANSILYPIFCRTKYPDLNTFRKLVICDTIPAYARLNQRNATVYTPTGSRISDGYREFLLSLNVALRKLYPIPNPSDLDKLLSSWQKRQKDLGDYDATAMKDWSKKHAADPSLSFQAWDADYGYSQGHEARLERADEAYGQYQAAASPYPILDRVARKLRMLSEQVMLISLPMDESEVQNGKESWNAWLKQFINADIDDFMANDVPQSIEINQASSTSTSYESRWSGSASVGYGFFSFSGGASGGTVDNHLRQQAQNLKITFKRMNVFGVTRGPWYDEGLIRTHNGDVDFKEFWGSIGTLNVLPQAVVLVRGPMVEITTQQQSYDEFRNWYTASAGGGFSLGPFSIGASGSSSTSYANIQNASNGTTIRISDKSDTIYLLAVVSLKADELAQSTAGNAIVAASSLEAVTLNNEWSKKFGKLVAQGDVDKKYRPVSDDRAA